jgi:hypothetical protein
LFGKHNLWGFWGKVIKGNVIQGKVVQGNAVVPNLNTRTHMFELLLQTFWAKKNLAKSLLISTLDKVIY